VLSGNELDILKKMRRDIVKVFLETFILTKLKNNTPLSGYDFIEIIPQKFGFLLSPGTVYSALYSMERKGLIKPLCVRSFESRKRAYTITEEGKKLLLINAKFEDSIVSLLRGIFRD
jgi:DNA-binding PadR family transcriptional regulator